MFDAEAMTHVDSTGIDMLLDLAHELEREGITLVFARLRRRLMDDLGVAGLTDAIGPGHFYASVRLAGNLIRGTSVAPTREYSCCGFATSIVTTGR